MSHPTLTADEIAKRGEELYERGIRGEVEEKHQGEVLVLDIETGGFEVDADHLTALRRARARCPGGTFYALRIGGIALGRLRRGTAAPAAGSRSTSRTEVLGR